MLLEMLKCVRISVLLGTNYVMFYFNRLLHIEYILAAKLLNLEELTPRKHCSYIVQIEQCLHHDEQLKLNIFQS